VSATAALEADIEIEARPEQVWTVVSDLARMGEWSPECRKVIVFGSPREGAHLVGLNRRRWVAWPTNSRIVRYEPGRAIAWKVFTNRATWSYELEPTEGGGTRLIERRDMPPQGIAPFAGLFGKVFLGGVESHDAELQEGMRATLDRIKSEVERG
jgi:Polyketide cyclase / dehydrase and lipid transport